MYYLTNYTYLEQLKHKRKLGFKYNTIEELIIVLYAYNLSLSIIKFLKEYKEKKNDTKRTRLL